MFPYNDTEMAWISRKSVTKTRTKDQNVIYTILVALTAAILSAAIPPMIYFLRLNLL